MVKRCCLVLLFLAFLLGMKTIVRGQVAEDLDFILAYNPIDQTEGGESSSFTFNQTNELKVTLMGLIRIYQLFISTQDTDVCNFQPSCSRFGMTALKRYGPFHGILMISDRLQRCNGIGGRYYPLHPETGKSYDPVELNFLGNK